MTGIAAAIGLVIGLLALLSLMSVLLIHVAHPPAGRFVDAGGIKLHVLDAGTGVPVVLIHGASGTLNDWRASVFDDLAHSFRAIAIDRPGHGHSERPRQRPDAAEQAALVRTALKNLAAERPVLVGHSWGGALVLAYALAWPDEVRGIVLLGPATHPWEGKVSLVNRTAALPVVGALFRWLAVPLAGRIIMPKALAGIFWPDPVPARYGQAAQTKLVLRPWHFWANAQDMVGLKPFLAEQAQHYERLAAPAIVLSGNRDRVVFYKNHSLRLAEAAKHVQFRKIPGAGHMPHHAAKDEVMAAIREIAALN